MKSAAKQRCKTNKKKKNKILRNSSEQHGQHEGAGPRPTSAKKCKQFIEFAITRTFGTHTHTQRDACNVC